MTKKEDNTCITCGMPLDEEDWYPTAPWVPQRLGGWPTCLCRKRGRLVEVLDDMGVEYTIEPA
ncbi:hypothetical protein [Mycobacteroides abscessus]|uniref:hypothetical protein n=1 Tax=Mycobacteroides abscessus TaxID=36809 RepID=UPI0019D240C0|nr:hypothetical protein [Mycobacteroides abscessus]MBN7310352.1 hypothetical protein [Mycobacteroides abscessus subsp. abscessus]